MTLNSEGGTPVGIDSVPMDMLFESTVLNSQGKEKADAIGKSFSALLGMLTTIVAETNTREFALVRTKLQEACFFAKRAVALQGENRAPGQ